MMTCPNKYHLYLCSFKAALQVGLQQKSCFIIKVTYYIACLCRWVIVTDYGRAHDSRLHIRWSNSTY